MTFTLLQRLSATRVLCDRTVHLLDRLQFLILLSPQLQGWVLGTVHQCDLNIFEPGKCVMSNCFVNWFALTGLDWARLFGIWLSMTGPRTLKHFCKIMGRKVSLQSGCCLGTLWKIGAYKIGRLPPNKWIKHDQTYSAVDAR